MLRIEYGRKCIYHSFLFERKQKNKVFCFVFRNNGKTGMGYNGVAINKRTRREIENISDRKEHEYMIGRKKRK